MGIKDKATYGEYYWAMQVEATAAFDEQLEDALSPFFRGLLNDIPEISALPAGMRTFMSAFAEPPSAGFGDLIKLTGGEFAAEVVKDAISPAMLMLKRSVNKRAKETWLTSQQANLLFQRGKITYEYWNEVLESEGYEPVIARGTYDSQMPYPSIPDFVLYGRYHGDPDSPRQAVADYFDVATLEFKVWEWLQLQRLNTLQVHTLFRRGLITDTSLDRHLAQIGWAAEDKSFIEETGWSIPNAMLLVQANLMQQKSSTEILRDISIADIHPEYAEKYLDAVLTKPSSQDIIAYELRRDPKLSQLDAELRRIGIHEEYFDLYKKLAQQIPPVADIITMAVREAFSPGIAAKFGQYQDFPQPLEEWGEKKGLSKEWTRRYWAAHWSLPSPLQGFEMLHRGAINEGELNMLLRALDVMPFWRHKLTKIAYRRVTRVDIRRMYKSGIITAKDVFDANKELGYTDRDAKRMTDFTVQWALPKHASITRSDILMAYKTRMINRADASDLLENMGEEYFHREFMLKAVDYKKGLELTELQIKGISNLYKRRVINDDTARADLLKLDLPSDEVDSLMQQWYYELKAEIPRHWTTSQTLGFVKEGLITAERGRKELVNIGYDTEHIDVYMRTNE